MNESERIQKAEATRKRLEQDLIEAFAKSHIQLGTNPVAEHQAWLPIVERLYKMGWRNLGGQAS